MSVQILIGDARERLKDLPDASVHCCVTSPPYFGLRDYGVDGQMGLEATPDEFVAGMVELFREVRRVLRDDGTLWLNLGDSYSGGGRGGNPGHSEHQKQRTNAVSMGVRGIKRSPLKDKDLIGIPWMVAFALRADGWFLRQDIIWSKPNPMPESVRDRCTKAHEYLFLLAKSGETTCWRHDERRWAFERPEPDYVWRNRDTGEESSTPREGDDWRRVNRWQGYDYYYDADAIAEGLAPASVERLAQDTAALRGSDRVPGKTNGRMKAVAGGRTRGLPPRHAQYPESSDQSGLDQVGRGMGRNKRSVWTVATQPFSGAHFATFPPSLIEPCILAGCPKGGTVLDPFGGAGTTGLVAERLGRDAILIELNPEYADLARDRMRSELCQVESEALEPEHDAGPLFGSAAA